MTSGITKVGDVKTLVARARADPDAAFAEIRNLAASDDWQVREVAATVLVETAKKHPAAVARNALAWSRDADPNVRRAASEGLRGLVKVDPEAVRPVLMALRADQALYVKKSVANVLRNASGKHPDLVLELCTAWARSPDANTRWIVKDGLRKLKASRPTEVRAILGP